MHASAPTCIRSIPCFLECDPQQSATTPRRRLQVSAALGSLRQLQVLRVSQPVVEGKAPSAESAVYNSMMPRLFTGPSSPLTQLQHLGSLEIPDTADVAYLGALKALSVLRLAHVQVVDAATAARFLVRATALLFCMPCLVCMHPSWLVWMASAPRPALSALQRQIRGLHVHYVPSVWTKHL